MADILETFPTFWSNFGERWAAEHSARDLAQMAWHAGGAAADSSRTRSVTSLPPCFTSDMWGVWLAIPTHLHPGLWHYFTEHRPVGSFLTAVLANDFADAVLRADPTISTLALRSLAYLINAAPSRAVGSRENVQQWTTEQVL